MCVSSLRLDSFPSGQSSSSLPAFIVFRPYHKFDVMRNPIKNDKRGTGDCVHSHHLPDFISLCISVSSSSIKSKSGTCLSTLLNHSLYLLHSIFSLVDWTLWPSQPSNSKKDRVVIWAKFDQSMNTVHLPDSFETEHVEHILPANDTEVALCLKTSSISHWWHYSALLSFWNLSYDNDFFIDGKYIQVTRH